MPSKTRSSSAGKTLYIYPQLYEGKECDTDSSARARRRRSSATTFIPWLIKNGGKRFALPCANYVWPHLLNAYARKVIEANGGEVIFEEYYPLDQIEFSATVNRIMTKKVDVVFNTVIPPGVGPFFKQLYEAGFRQAGRTPLPASTTTRTPSTSTRPTRSKGWRAASTISAP